MRSFLKRLWQWIRGFFQQEENKLSFGGELIARPFKLDPKALLQARTTSELLDAICGQFKCSYGIRFVGKRVEIALTFQNGNRLVASGDDLRDAILHAKSLLEK